MSPQRARLVTFVVAGVAVAGILLFVASRLDVSGRSTAPERRIEHPEDLVNPAPLTEAERANSSGAMRGPGAESTRRNSR